MVAPTRLFLLRIIPASTGGLVVLSGYSGPEGQPWDRFLADMDAMVTTLELTGGGPRIG
jgi:hypothetical protein